MELHMGVARRCSRDGDPGQRPASAVDAVFSSERYGGRWPSGSAPGTCQSTRTGNARVSGTAIRRDRGRTGRTWRPPPERACAPGSVVLGAESTGTTTLSRQLAAHLDAPWVPEYGRLHRAQAGRRARSTGASADRLVWTVSDFRTWPRREELVRAASTGPVVVCDNDAWAARSGVTATSARPATTSRRTRRPPCTC
ncbi:ATP-binding protein [Saccharothrix sp. MB29]|nr:ATP-binding protein [Saccharothrix sp. MB29]